MNCYLFRFSSSYKSMLLNLSYIGLISLYLLYESYSAKEFCSFFNNSVFSILQTLMSFSYYIGYYRLETTFYLNMPEVVLQTHFPRRWFFATWERKTVPWCANSRLNRGTQITLISLKYSARTSAMWGFAFSQCNILPDAFETSPLAIDLNLGDLHYIQLRLCVLQRHSDISDMIIIFPAEPSILSSMRPS